MVHMEYVRMYYEHQYDRMAKLEEQRLAITNIVITLSMVAITFGFSDVQSMTLITGIGLPSVMVLSNLFAIAYVVRSAKWIRIHRKRAKRVLEMHAQVLLKQIDERAGEQPRRHTSLPRLFARWRIQLYIHILLILIAILIPVYLYAV